jgi:hypothetical protein
MTNQDAVGSRSAGDTRKASGDGPGVGRGGRMSRQRKRDAVLRLLRGEDLETVSRALGGHRGHADRLAGGLPGCG